MEYIIYFDESVNDGEYYSDFFGGVLVRNTDYDVVRCALDTMKQALNLNGEIKWIKVTANYLEKYKQIMNLFFSYIKGNRLKVRIMFRETSQSPHPLSSASLPVPQSSPKDSHGRCSGNRLQKARNSTVYGCCFGLYFLHA